MDFVLNNQTHQIKFATPSAVTFNQGTRGPKGETGVGIASISKTASEGLQDAYTITFTDGTTTIFYVNNGKDGKDGKDGAAGAAGKDGKDGVNGKDGYTPVKGIDYFDGQDGTNGTNGTNGKSLQFNWNGTQLGVRVEGDIAFTYVDLKGQTGATGAAGTNGVDGADGAAGKDGVGIQSTTINASGHLIITLTDSTVIDVGNVVGKDGIDGTDANIIIDSLLSDTSVNAVQNKVIKAELDKKANSIDIPVIPTKVSNFENDAGYLTQHQDISGKADKSSLSTVATSGNYNDLNNKPVIPSIPTALSSFINDTGFINSTVDNLNNYYTKDLSYNKSEINTMIGNINSIKINVVESLPISNIDVSTIYMVNKSNKQSQNIYTEYLYVNGHWEIIGDSAIDLTPYYKATQVDNLLLNKVDKITGKELSTNDYTTQEKNKLSGIEAEAQKNTITSVNGLTGDIVIDIPTKVSELTNDSGYLTQHQDLTDYAKKSEIPDVSGKANVSDLATVATSGKYSDLNNKPTIPNKISDLTDDIGVAKTSEIPDISGKANTSDLKTVAFTGNYGDLINAPSIVLSNNQPTQTTVGSLWFKVL